MALDHEQYVELVLGCVERVPRGRVTTYGAIAEVVRKYQYPESLKS